MKRRITIDVSMSTLMNAPDDGAQRLVRIYDHGTGRVIMRFDLDALQFTHLVGGQMITVGADEWSAS